METLLYILLGLNIILMISYVFSDKNEKFNLLLMISLVFPIISLSEKIGNDETYQKIESKQPKKKFKFEYEIELINKNKVKIKSVDSDKIYICKPEEIDSIFIIDNL
jgi:uncharacterized FlgJ-related protein